MIDPVSELQCLLEAADTSRVSSSAADEIAWRRELADFQREMELEIRAASRSCSCGSHT